jgi:hypothetical protein
MSRFGFLTGVVFTAVVATRTWAGYAPNGYDLGVVQTGSGLANSAASLQTNPLNLAATLNTTLTTNFTIPSCQTIDYARLYLDIYSGTPYHTGQLTGTVNGQTLPALTIGGTGSTSGTGMPADGNPSTRDPNATCVYGSGFGYWQVALANVGPLLNTNGAANTITFSTADPTNSSFDGRAYGATLAAVYTDPTIQQTLDYQLFEGDGFLRQTASATPPGLSQNLSRSLTIAGVNTSNVLAAIYTAEYAVGHTGQTDQLYFDGTALGPTIGLGNDIARANSNTELHRFDVSSYLQGSNTLNYSIDQSVLGGTGESSVHADLGLLTVTHPVPEPASLATLVLGGLALLTRKRRT